MNRHCIKKIRNQDFKCACLSPMRRIHICSLMNRRLHKPNTHVGYTQRPNLIKHINHETNTITYNLLKT